LDEDRSSTKKLSQVHDMDRFVAKFVPEGNRSLHKYPITKEMLLKRADVLNRMGSHLAPWYAATC